MKALSLATSVYKGRTNAGYYPDHGQILLRVHYDKKSRLVLGAQAVGDKGVDKRIDVIATAIMGKMTVDDLAALELVYSPAYSSPKDPVNMVGYKANSIMKALCIRVIVPIESLWIERLLYLIEMF